MPFCQHLSNFHVGVTLKYIAELEIHATLLFPFDRRENQGPKLTQPGSSGMGIGTRLAPCTEPFPSCCPKEPMGASAFLWGLPEGTGADAL